MTNKEIDSKNLDNATKAMEDMLKDVAGSEMPIDTAFLGGYHSGLMMAFKNPEMAEVLKEACDVLGKKHEIEAF
jgi:hypothetical protein